MTSVPESHAANLKEGYKKYGAFGDKKFSGNNMTLKNADKWFKESGVFKMKNISTTDTSIVFKQVVGNSINVMTFDQFKEFCAKIADRSNKNDGQSVLNDMLNKLISQANPGLSNTTGVSATGGVDRLTDVKGYTGAHKERFNEDGTGKGIGGREDINSNTGYTGQYKGAGTYDNTHQ